MNHLASKLVCIALPLPYHSFLLYHYYTYFFYLCAEVTMPVYCAYNRLCRKRQDRRKKQKKSRAVQRLRY